MADKFQRHGQMEDIAIRQNSVPGQEPSFKQRSSEKIVNRLENTLASCRLGNTMPT
jgi:hypothetical protein